MTWVVSEQTKTTASCDGKYQVREHGEQSALYQTGLGRPLMIGALDDCRHLAEVLESDDQLEDVPPLRGRTVVPIPELKARLLGGKAVRSLARLAILREVAAPREMVALELSLLRRITCDLMKSVHELPELT